MEYKNAKKPLKQLKILGVGFSSTSIEGVIKYVDSSLKKKSKFFISTPNPEIAVESYKNRQLSVALASSDIAIPDGIGISIVSSLLYGKSIKRIQGRVLFRSLLEYANDHSLKVYFLGASQKVNTKLRKKIFVNYPNIIIDGDAGPKLSLEASPVSDFYTKSHIVTLNSINKFSPDLLFVAFGAPKQEIWTFKHINRLNVGGVMVVGGTFDYFVGHAREPFSIISSLGLEWLWRLAQQPKRIYRILNAVFLFPTLAIAEKGGFVKVE